PGPTRITRCGPATRRCACRRPWRSTPRVSSARTGCPCRSGWGSTPARWWSAPSARICTWTTPPWGTPRTWPPGWSRWRRRARSCSPRRRPSSPKATCRSRPGGGAGGPVAAKGWAEPLAIYALTGESAQRTRLHATAARGFTQFVGREGELGQLRQALGRARDGRGQLVAVVGEPGVGKSRLVYEFTHFPGSQAWLVLEAGALSYGTGAGYPPVLRVP